MGDREAVLEAFRSELEIWRFEHPGWTEHEQLIAFSPYLLWRRAGGGVIDLDTGNYAQADGELYRDLMIAAGYVVPKRLGDDGNLPCGWPGR